MELDAIHIGMLRDAPDTALAEAEAIFFASSTVQSFTDRDARIAFRERWFGRYVDHYSEDFLVARDGVRVVGYLAGCATDIGTQPAFAREHVCTSFISARQLFPAHLHINVDAAARSAGVGSRLLRDFIERLMDRNIIGVHVVTASGARNVGFYRRNGFQTLAEATSGTHQLLMLGLKL
jgi:ribosomal protein S18 acetylase RimI-like enzyme